MVSSITLFVVGATGVPLGEAFIAFDSDHLLILHTYIAEKVQEAYTFISE